MPVAPGRSRRLVTDRLTLVPQTVDAARALLAGGNAGLPLAQGYPHADSLDGLRLVVDHARDDEELGGWFVILAETGELIGDCGTKGGPDERGWVEIGYGVAAAFRGRGYASEAVGAMVAWLGTQPGTRAVTAEVEVGNVASRRLLERLGFGLEDTVDGCWWLVLPV